MPRPAAAVCAAVSRSSAAWCTAPRSPGAQSRVRLARRIHGLHKQPRHQPTSTPRAHPDGQQPPRAARAARRRALREAHAARAPGRAVWPGCASQRVARVCQPQHTATRAWARRAEQVPCTVRRRAARPQPAHTAARLPTERMPAAPASRAAARQQAPVASARHSRMTIRNGALSIFNTCEKLS